MRTEEMRLDGNAAAGALREVFARDMTSAMVSLLVIPAPAPAS